jgi:hypothetical protein
MGRACNKHGRKMLQNFVGKARSKVISRIILKLDLGEIALAQDRFW